MNLFQRINEVRKAVEYVQKDATIDNKYRAVTHDMVTAVTRKHFIEHGVLCIPTLIESTFDLPLVATDGTTAKQRLYSATYDFSFINVDAPEEKAVIRMQGHAMDNADKAPGKALSYAKKYAVLKLLDLETGENEEGRMADNDIDEEVLAQLVASLSNAKTLDELKAAYETSYPIAEKAKDTEAMKAIIKAKNARGKALMSAKESAK